MEQEIRDHIQSTVIYIPASNRELQEIWKKQHCISDLLEYTCGPPVVSGLCVEKHCLRCLIGEPGLTPELEFLHHATGFHCCPLQLQEKMGGNFITSLLAV